MNKFLGAAFVLAIGVNQSIGATFVTAVAIVPAPGLVSALSEVCSGKYVLTVKAKTACDTQNFPKLAKKGELFTVGGIGGEFNTLIRQIKH